MTWPFVYWFILLVWLLFNGAVIWSPQVQPWGWRGNGLILFVLFCILGWHDFGPPIHW